MSRFDFLRDGARLARQAVTLAFIAALAACSAGGPATMVNQPTSGSTSTANSYTGPAASNADVQAFKVSVWENIRPSNRCGGCHHEGGQSPMFARSDDVNLAYQAANPLINFTQPDQSTIVLKVKSGHNCWLSDPQACADTLTTWIKAWVGAGSGAATGVTLQQPPTQSAQGGKQFPACPTTNPPAGCSGANLSTPSYATTIYPIVHKFCIDCHRSNGITPQTPYFASDDLNESYAAAQAKIDLNTPTNSRFYVRLHDESHHCWITTGTAPDCPGSAAAMLKAIQDYAGGITATPMNANALLSGALKLKQGTVASGSNRYETNLVAKYEFKSGTGFTAFDTSGVNPSADLTLSGAVTWVNGWGITLAAGGKAQASSAASQKIAQMIQSTGEYSIEVWAAPANVTQTNANIVSYSGSDTTRNATLAQQASQYEADTRTDKSDTNAQKGTLTDKTKTFAQASLQHVVMTFDPTHGQKIYVNGNDTGAVDAQNVGGKLANWDSSFALVVGAETTGKRQWLGTIRFVAIHNRALTAAQVQQNYAAGVGERYYMLFDVSTLTGVPQAYIEMEASQYDNYSYLLNKPTFISLNPNAAPANVVIKGIRIGVNGSLAKSGQSYATVNATVGGSNYTAASGQLLANVGAVVAADQGADNDMLYLSFDQIGSASNPFAEPGPVATSVFDDASLTTYKPRPDYGIMTFDRLNQTFSNITGVPTTNTAVATVYTTQDLKQSLPAAPAIDAFVASNQTAIAQLATTYCGQLVNTQSLRDAFFGTSLDASIAANAGSVFGNGTNAASTTVINALLKKASVDVGAAAGTRLDLIKSASSTELTALLARFNDPAAPAALRNATASTAIQAACSALLGSAAVTLQ